MVIRQAFQTFLSLQSEADPDRQAGNGRAQQTSVADAWPLDHTPRTAARDWTLDWRWFASEGEQ